MRNIRPKINSAVILISKQMIIWTIYCIRAKMWCDCCCCWWCRWCFWWAIFKMKNIRLFVWLIIKVMSLNLVVHCWSPDQRDHCNSYQDKLWLCERLKSTLSSYYDEVVGSSSLTHTPRWTSTFVINRWCCAGIQHIIWQLVDSFE